MRYKLFAYSNYNTSEYRQKSVGFQHMICHNEIDVEDHILNGSDAQLVNHLARNSPIVRAILSSKRPTDIDVHYAGDNDDELEFTEQLPLFYLKQVVQCNYIPELNPNIKPEYYMGVENHV